MEVQQAKYFLGIDWGLNKTGLAIADDELRIATVLSEVETVNLIGEIEEVQKEYDFSKIIFGGLELDEQFGGDESEVRSKKGECLDKLDELGIKVEIAEEMLSTKMAQQNLLEGGKKMVSKQDNGEAAKIILQGWLDNE